VNVASYIARRYLFSKKSKNIINLISMISLSVVAFVTAAMIIVLSAFNGIEELVHDLFSNFDAPFTIVPEQGQVIPDSLFTDEWFSRVDGLAYYTRFIEHDAWLNYSRSNVVATVKGVESDYTRLAPFDSMMYMGTFQLNEDSFPTAVVGMGVRTELMLPIEPDFPSRIEINAPVRGRKLSRYRQDAFRQRYIPVVGAYTANVELDHKYVFVPLPFARELFGMEHHISGVELLPADGVREDVFRKNLSDLLPEGMKIQTRYDKNALIYKTNESEKWATFLILVFILIIASFNIVAALTMLIIEKKNDIYILGSMGLSRTDVRKVFMLEGILINLLGAGVGTLLGVGVCLAQQSFGLVTMVGAVVDYYPIVIDWIDVVSVFFTVTILGSLFSVVLVHSLLKRFAWTRSAA